MPAHVRELADEVWCALQPLADRDADVAAAERALDDARARYRALYAEAEAIAQSSVTAAKRRKGAARKPPPAPPPPAVAAGARRAARARALPARGQARPAPRAPS